VTARGGIELFRVLTTGLPMSQNAALDIRPPLASQGMARGEEGEPVYGGLSLSAWLKIGIVAVLMVATFRFNLLRLWLKTNPVNGEPTC
jgi:hypothetical protein